MQPSEPNDRPRSSRDRDTNVVARPPRRLTAAGLVLFALVGASVLTVGPAAAEDTPAVLAATTPTITEPADGAFIGNNAPFTLSGTKAAGSGIEVRGAAECSVAADDAEQWSCAVRGLPNGPRQTISATETMENTLGGASPSPDAAASVTVDVLGPPSLDGKDGLRTSGTISGVAMPGAAVVAVVSSLPEPGCESKALDNGYWSCSLAVPSGTYSVSVRQSNNKIYNRGDSSDLSASKIIAVDKVAPAPPKVTSPRAGSRITKQPARYAGTGEMGGWVDAYVDGRIVCSASVVAGSWRCSADGIRSGTHYVQAIQRDAAGNYSSPSGELRVFFGAKQAAPPAIVPPVPSPNATPTPTPSASPSPAAPLPPFDPPFDPPRADPPPASTNWGTPTGFGAALSTPAELLSGGNWPLVPLAAALFIALIALPMRLLATVSRGRMPALPRLLGRNRALGQADVRKGPRDPWLTGLLPLGAAVGLIVLATGVGAEVRYLRLTAAVGFALALLNTLAVITTRIAARGQRISARVKFLPVLLLAVALLAVISRTAGVVPPMVSGVMIGVVFAAGVTVRSRAVVNLAGLGSVAVLSLLAWLLHSWLAPTAGFWAAFASESLAALCLAGLGSLVILSLPIAALPGRAILEWSIPVWLATMATTTALASSLIFASGSDAFPPASWLLAGCAFAAVSVATWAWFRFVEESR